MHSFTRVHDTGTQTVLHQHGNRWRINIDLRESNHSPLTIVGYLAPTVQKAKQLADSEILKYGHICTAACKGWVET